MSPPLGAIVRIHHECIDGIEKKHIVMITFFHHKVHRVITNIDSNMLIDSPLPLLGYLHYDFLKLHYLIYKMTYVSSLICNSHVNYVTLL